MSNGSSTRDSENSALVVGATGMAGGALCEQLIRDGWTVYGLSLRPSERKGVVPITADLTAPASISVALANLNPSHIFITAWIRMKSEAENIRVNGGMVRDLLASVPNPSAVKHVALVTGLKHYVGPFEAYGTGAARDTPFHEDEPRLDVPNFYYAQEDELWKASETHQFTWSVHRAHTMLGFVVGNLMNMGLTLAVQAALCRERGTAFRFPGNDVQWNAVTDMTEVGILARQMIWAATTPEAANLAFNTANGDLFRWRWMWPRLAELLGVEPAGYADQPETLTANFDNDDSARDWRSLSAKHDLRVPDVTRLASWWHTDSDLNLPIEAFTDLTRSKRLGFLDHVVTVDAFGELFDRLRSEKIIPKL